jgi:hypothetical protein
MNQQNSKAVARTNSAADFQDLSVCNDLHNSAWPPALKRCFRASNRGRQPLAEALQSSDNYGAC